MNPDFQNGQPSQPVPQIPQPGYDTVAQQQGYASVQPVSSYAPQLQPQPQPQPQFPQQPPVGPPSNYIVPPKKHSKVWIILSIVFITTTIALIGLGVWLYLNYTDQKDNVDAKVSSAVTVAVKNQADKDAADFLEKEKQPNRQFAGPEDYGRVSFDYPKTWSIYVDKDTSTTDTYAAYFNPVSVPKVAADTQYALRVLIEQKDYDKVLTTYDSLVKKGDLKLSPVKIDGLDGTRLDGAFSKDIHGAAVIFKIRDKTVTIRTDAETFIRNKTALDGSISADAEGDFGALVKTITFNK
ncbi:MAG: hypothetical protein WAQ27_03255 [Candidatus Microsaccharimonas sp.]